MPECQGFASTGVSLSEIVNNPLYDIYRFWIRRIMTIFIPFFVLASCNVAIVYNLRGNQKDKMVKHLILHMTSGHSKDLTRLKSRVRTATQILIIVVTCYLFANIIDVIIAFLEYMAPEALQEYDAFYTIATDVSSLLSTLSSALRLPIYIANDKLIRHEIFCQVKRIYYRVLCCKTQNAKQRAFDSEKRRLVYEQVEQASTTPPAINSNPGNRSRISVDSSKIHNGIGGLIFARASVTSSMHDSTVTNFDITKCAAIYAHAVSRQGTRLSSDSSLDDSLAQCVVCENPQGPNGSFSYPRKVSLIDPRGPIRKKISAPPKLSFDIPIIEANDSDVESKSTSNNTPVPLKRNYNDRGDMLYWSSNI
uniref:G-protein coupled receptors family 1 profile domain-containing protein n=1 Tax=Panagrolaimus superbus TaxID=310955 RepID=A0A914YWZ3_9BILA